jgi:hypothetical protein
MNYLLRLLISFALILVIYQAVQVLRRQIAYERYQNYNQNHKYNFTELKTLNKNFIVDNMEELYKMNEETYESLETPNEWYDFNARGYSYLDPNAWKGEQHQPVCYDKDDTHPAAIMSPGIDQFMFYKPGEGKKTNTEMVFEQKPEIVWKTTIRERTNPLSEIV